MSLIEFHTSFRSGRHELYKRMEDHKLKPLLQYWLLHHPNDFPKATTAKGMSAFPDLFYWERIHWKDKQISPGEQAEILMHAPLLRGIATPDFHVVSMQKDPRSEFSERHWWFWFWNPEKDRTFEIALNASQFTVDRDGNLSTKDMWFPMGVTPWPLPLLLDTGPDALPGQSARAVNALQGIGKLNTLLRKEETNPLTVLLQSPQPYRGLARQLATALTGLRDAIAGVTA